MLNLKKEFLFIIFFLIFPRLFSNEFIKDLKIRDNGPFEDRIYLIDDLKGENYGYYSIRPLINYKDNNNESYFLGPSLFLNSIMIENNVIDLFNNKVKNLKSIINLWALNKIYITNEIFFIITQSIGFSTLLTGIVLYATSLTELTSGEVSWDLKIIKPFEYLQYPGLGVLLTGAGFSVLGLAVFLPVFLYNYNLYKKNKKTLLNQINGIIVGDSRGNKLFTIKPDLIITI